MSTTLLNSNESGQFSGHETFPLRQLWLPKIARLVNSRLARGVTADFTSDKEIDEVMLELGVGRNMVSAARFWSQACGMLKREKTELTPLGQMIFGSAYDCGCDPYCTNSATIWLVHWNLASQISNFTPVWYLFNAINQPSVDRQSFVDGMRELCRQKGWKVSDLTLKRAQECTLRSYLPRLSGKGRTEDFVEPLLAELDLLETTPARDVFLIHRGSHPTLPDAVFIYALLMYWQGLGSGASALDFGRIAHDFNSPGRVFKLDGDSLARRLQRLQSCTNGMLEWTEQAGLRQVIRRGEALNNPQKYALEILQAYY